MEVAGDSDQVELKILHNASVSCLKKYNDEPTAARMRDLDAAREGLAELIERLWSRYYPDEDRFKNLLEAMKFLKGQGYKIGKSKIYKDAQQKQIRVQADGSILKRDAEAYAKTLKLLGDPLRGLEATQKRKGELEVRRLEQIVAALEHEQEVREGKYVLKADAELDRANNAGAIFTALSNGLLSSARELLDAAKGDPHRLVTFIEALKRELERAANSLSKLEEFELVFVEQGAGSGGQGVSESGKE
jgi:hypothetical protein